MAPMAPERPIETSLFDPAWLGGRRWFRSKSRQLQGVEAVDLARLDERSWLVVLAARFADGPEEHYLAPAIEEAGALREPRDGDGAWRALVARIADGPAEQGARLGSFRFEATDALGTFLADRSDGREAERAFTGEQSNTSVRIGDSAVLKVYRLLERGINPEVEIGEFLTAHAFSHAPVVGGHASYRFADGGEASAAMLQRLVPSRGDAWDWIQRHLAEGADGARETLAGLSQVGGLTAELHATLASEIGDERFPNRPATPDEAQGWQQDGLAQFDRALEAVSGDDRERLARLAPRVRAALEPLASAAGTPVSRIHGDYHLGQLLRTESGFAVIDFEGEPARSLAQRGRPSSPLRDVAGMLRSLDYAGRTAERRGGLDDADAWVADARRAFLNAYGIDGAMPEPLTPFEVTKACYEVAYEANNRPDWVWLPMAALERLVA